MSLQLQQISSFALPEVPRVLARAQNPRDYLASVQGQLSGAWTCRL